MNKILQIYQFKDSYCYNSDSLFLWDFAKNYIKNDFNVLDVGSGSGIVGLLCARNNKINLTQVEMQENFYLINIKNAKVNKIESNVVHQDFRFYNGNDKFDLIISNPPFYNQGHISSINESIDMARSSLYLNVKDFAFNAMRLLKPHARLIFCYHASALQEVMMALQEYKINIDFIRFVHPRVDLKAKIVLINARINSKSNVTILPPLITHIGTSQLDNSNEVKEIYKNANVYSIKINSVDLDEAILSDLKE